MSRRLQTAALAVGLVLVLGCTSVQKGTAAGGAGGAAAGAALGHYVAGIGSGPGALAGLGLGAAAGAVTADRVYDAERTGESVADEETFQELSKELSAKDSQLAELTAALEREKAQQKALLQAYEKARSERKTLATRAPAEGAKGLQVVADGDAVTFTILSEVLFASGKADLSREGKAALDAAARTIRAQYPDSVIEVRGHTDNVPIRYSKFKSNWDLSCARALAVVSYLRSSHGFDAGRFKTTGCGERRPIASNSSEAGRRKNRRAEIVVWLNKKSW
jgi:chemotaxis protein MotB